MQLDQVSPEQLSELESNLANDYQAVKNMGLSLDLTRGKPGTDQLTLSDTMDGILEGNYKTAGGVDARNYGGLDGIPEAKALGAELLGVASDAILVGGNSSLTLMHQIVSFAYYLGVDNNKDNAWSKEGQVKFICPVPGYDRHFSICEQLGIEMINVPMTDNGPDMDAVEALVKSDGCIKGIWCVPKYANPTGTVFSDETVDRIAALAKIAGKNFRVMWDNAYAIHDLTTTPPALASIADKAEAHGTQDSIIQFASTSKITYAGAGLAFLTTSPANTATIKAQLGISTIGPDKVNQLRHAKFFAAPGSLQAHMDKHREIIQPRFQAVLVALESAFGDADYIRWTKPQGGYFISVDLLPGLAKNVVALCGEAGVKLTPAGATFPYGKDPDDKNIRFAPTFPAIDEITKALDVFVLCVKLARVRAKLAR